VFHIGKNLLARCLCLKKYGTNIIKNEPSSEGRNNQIPKQIPFYVWSYELVRDCIKVRLYVAEASHSGQFVNLQ
jgi:hypothetical protein